VLRLVRVRAAARQIRIERMLEGGLPPLWGDPRLLRQALLNLLSNAIKFTPAEGTVVLAARQDGTAIVLEVSDTGIGIAEEDLPRIMEPFVQGEVARNRKFEGTGLGLALTKAMVEAHGGILEIESRVGLGTTVRIKLPQRAAAE